MKRITEIKEAAYFAIAKHGSQTYDEYPYYYHLEQVVDILEQYGYTEDVFIISGYLHDILEDTDTSYNDIKEKFGERVAEIVYCVTDELGRNRKERKAKTLPKIAGNMDAIIIKLADRIANLRKPKMKNMYVKEYKEFKDALYIFGHADEMWAELDYLTGTGGKVYNYTKG